MSILVAGPCAIQSEAQAFEVARYVLSKGCTIFRGGAYKGQNRPIVNGVREYLGLGDKAVKILAKIQDMLNIPCSCDMQSVRQAEVLREYNILYPQVGARNMDSLELLRQFNKIFKNTSSKIILKRGPSATISEWIGAAEHLGGPDKVILCERGTVHFDRHDYTRYRLDFVGIAEVKTYHPDYTILVDPSHGSGNYRLVPLLTRSALTIADGIMVEVDKHPTQSPTDAPQIIGFDDFDIISNMVIGKYSDGGYNEL